MLCITNNSIKHHSFVYTQLNDQTVLFQTIPCSISHLFALSLNVKQFCLTHWLDFIKCYHSEKEWTWERWQRTGTLHSPKLQHYRGLTIRLFGVILRYSLRFLPICREAFSVFYSHCQVGFLLRCSQGCMNWAPNENRTHSCRFASLPC